MPERATRGRPRLSLAERVLVRRFKAREHAALLDDLDEFRFMVETRREIHAYHADKAPPGLISEHEDRIIGAMLCAVHYHFHARDDADRRRVALAAEHLIVHDQPVPPKAVLIPPRATDLRRRNA
jgi:hypothetical protein